MAPYDGLVAGTIVMIVHRNSDRIEEIFSSCDMAFTSRERLPAPREQPRGRDTISSCTC